MPIVAGFVFYAIVMTIIAVIYTHQQDNAHA